MRSAQSRSASGRYSSNWARNRIEVIVFARQRFGTSGPSLPPPGPMPEPLTSTKVQIPELLGRGFTQQEIAIRLARRAFTMTGRSFARHRTSAFGHLVVRPLLARTRPCAGNDVALIVRSSVGYDHLRRVPRSSDGALPSLARGALTFPATFATSPESQRRRGAPRCRYAATRAVPAAPHAPRAGPCRCSKFRRCGFSAAAAKLT